MPSPTLRQVLWPNLDELRNLSNFFLLPLRILAFFFCLGGSISMVIMLCSENLGLTICGLINLGLFVCAIRFIGLDKRLALEREEDDRR